MRMKDMPCRILAVALAVTVFATSTPLTTLAERTEGDALTGETAEIQAENITEGGQKTNLSDSIVNGEQADSAGDAANPERPGGVLRTQKNLITRL